MRYIKRQSPHPLPRRIGRGLSIRHQTSHNRCLRSTNNTALPGGHSGFSTRTSGALQARSWGFRRDMNGKTIPTNIVDKVAVTLGGRELFSAELGTGLSANPYLQFYAVADASGELVVEWSDDRGEHQNSATVRLA